MKKIFLLISFFFVINVFSQDIINIYDPDNLVGQTLADPCSYFDGEYQIFLNELYWIGEGTPTNHLITYSIECVSYPFVPNCFHIESTTSSCISGNTARYFIVLTDDLRNYNINNPYQGEGWSVAGGKTVYQKCEQYAFNLVTNENETSWLSFPASLVSTAYTTSLGPSDRMYLPHSVLLITLNVHETEDITSDIKVKISWVYDNTRGRMQKYPFINNNLGTIEKERFDVTFFPNFKYDENGHYYNTTGNLTWFEGAHPATVIEPLGSINYYHNTDIVNPDIPYYPPDPSLYGDPFPWNNNSNFYYYPAPYALLSSPLRNANGSAYAGYDNDGEITDNVQEGQPHTYEIYDPIDLSLINPDEKIIYNPSELEVYCNLTFPQDYKFLTVHGQYPDKAWVEANNFESDDDLRNVLCPSDQIDENGEFLSEYIIHNKTITVQEGVTIMDTKFTGDGTIEYYPDNFNGNFKIGQDFTVNLYSQNFYINYGQKVWESEINFLGSVIYVEPGATLTVTNTLNMGEDSKIIVKRGAKLIIDGGIITGDSWQGIEVWGTSSQPQTLEYQGLVKVINGGTIKNAVCGIRAVKMDDPVEGGGETPNPSYSGGIVQAYDAVLQSNKTAVRFYEYTADNSISYFKNTDFFANYNSPDYLVYISGIDGISFTGCTFEDLRTNINITQRVNGITARDARIYVDESCDMYGNCTSSVFSDLNYGINAMTHDPMKTVTVKNSVFDKNHRSVFLSRTDNAIVLFNEFHPYTGPTMNGEDSYCLYLDYCSDYTVEENNFEHTGDQPGGIGLVINNSGADNNMIYRNDFSNLQYATLAENCNRGESQLVGLQIKCNDYWDNYQDIAVTADGEVEYPGIAHNQGADGGTDMQAGNLFSLNNNGNLESDYSTFKQAPITYYHHDPDASLQPRVKPEYYSEKFISLNKQNTIFLINESCPSDFSGGGGGSESDRDGMRSSMAENDSKADSVNALLSALVDGGNTEVLRQEVLQTMPPGAYDTYMALMGKSPYLSDSVLIATIEKEDALPNVLVKDILVANPQSAKSPEIMDKVEEKTVPMTDQMKAEILLGKYIVAAKEKLESQASYYRSARAAALKYLKQSYINDTLDPAAGDSLIALLESENGLHEKYQLAFAYLNKGDVESANTLVASLPSLYQFNAQQQQTYDDFAQLYGVISDLQTSAMPLDSLSAAQLQTLQQLADNSHNFAGAAARNILTIVAAYNYDEPVILPEAGMKSGIVFDLPGVSRNYKPEYVDIYPNPAMDYIIVELNKTNVNGVTLTLYDGKGNIIRTATIPGKTQYYVMGLKGLKPGIYILKADMDGKNIGSKKFSIVK